jgi:uncharacterized integral membrane protein
MNRWVHIAVIVVLALITLIFFFQNLKLVDFTFLGLTLRWPLAVIIAIFYALGLVTGSSLISLVRWAVRGAQTPRA